MMETPTSSSIKKAAASVNLESELTCSICTDLLYQPLTLLDCLHTFCGACLKEWFASQAYRAETSPLPPPPPSEQHKVFTCPACRDPVRDTKHDARVATLLEMFLAMNPERTRPEEERREMDERYRKGSKVLPRIKRWEDRTEEEMRLDEEERRVLHEVQEMSLREAWAALEAGNSGSMLGTTTGSATGSMVGVVGGGGGGGSAVGGSSERRRRASHAPHGSHQSQGMTSRDVSRNRASGTGTGTGSMVGRDRDRERVRDSSAAPSTSSRIRAQSATLHPENHYADERRRRRSESRQRETEERTRRLEHQSSLRSLISADDLGDIDIEREIEEFARQIQEEGLLDGLDLDNIDLDNNDELSKKIMEAYRRRHRERTRVNAERSARRNTAASSTTQSSYRPEPLVTSRTRPPPDHATRPASIRSGVSRSREPSASSNEERHRYPPSAGAAHLDVQGASRRRRTTSSASRSSTVPVPSQAEQQPRVSAHRSQTEVIRSSTTSEATQPIRPSVGVITETRSSSSPTVSSSNPLLTTTTANSSDMRALSFNARAAGIGVTQPHTQTDGSSDSDTSGRRRRRTTTTTSDRRPSTTQGKSEITSAPSVPNFVSTSGPVSIHLAANNSTPPVQPQLQPSNMPRYSEPLINCNGCGMEHIEYKLHFNCSICHNGDWNICLDCWRKRKGCLHWFGFGYAVWHRWNKAKASGHHPNLPPPHRLTAVRYLPPLPPPSKPSDVSSSSSSRARSSLAANPLDRLQSGTFCCRCSAFANECYWRCEFCNEGEWGFCNNCVNQEKACSHPLQALTYLPPASSAPVTSGTPPAPADSSAPPTTESTDGTTTTHSRSSSISQTTLPNLPPFSKPNLTAPSTGFYRPLTFLPPCDICSIPIPPSSPRFHCPSCPSKHAPSPMPRVGEYNICTACYHSLVPDSVAEENGAGTGQGQDGKDSNSDSDHKEKEKEKETQKEKWLQRLVSMDVSHPAVPPGHSPDEPLSPISSPTSPTSLSPSSGRSPPGVVGGRFTTDAFPPDGGTGTKVTARFSWYRSSLEAKNELIFPKGAEITEVEVLNEEWGVGWYMGEVGLFPRGYVR
ncbi:hypothetical protein B0T09DRAFT_384109 [Sordaria sp. MPI-SDFR-AT-0083]|nr:hypothetical protein B0T09DRAFT_384109 [Sordaria sp. MPI-SDFR-AT-0083]